MSGDPMRKISEEIESLAAENLALNAILTYALGHLAQSDPKLADAISRSFDQAANVVEDFVIKGGKTIPPEHGVKALRIIEDIRSKTLGDHIKPRRIV
jgi:hypothetical protein